MRMRPRRNDLCTVVVETGGVPMSTDVRQITWMRDFVRALNLAQAQHKNILLDFTAAPM